MEKSLNFWQIHAYMRDITLQSACHVANRNKKFKLSWSRERQMYSWFLVLGSCILVIYIICSPYMWQKCAREVTIPPGLEVGRPSQSPDFRIFRRSIWEDNRSLITIFWTWRSILIDSLSWLPFRLRLGHYFKQFK